MRGSINSSIIMIYNTILSDIVKFYRKKNNITLEIN